MGLRSPTVEFGKYKGWLWTQVPDDYLEWLIQTRVDDIAFYRQELDRRELVREAALPMAEQIVRAGYHALARKYHPDHGGSDVKMRELNAAHEGLKDWLSQDANP